MARDPWVQRHDERTHEDEEYGRRLEQDAADRELERIGGHLEVLADALTTPGRRAAVGFDPADGGKVVTAPVRHYQCPEHHEQRVFSLPKKVTDQAGLVVGYHYPVADGPYCLRCGRMMRLVASDEEVS